MEEHRGGVRIVSRAKPEEWIVDSTRLHGPNVVICKLVDGEQRMPLIGAYLSPSTLDHIPGLEESLNRFLGRDPIFLGDLNANIGRLRNTCD